MPIIPVTWEPEAGELLKPGRRKLQWGSKLRLCHCTPALLTEQDSITKKKELDGLWWWLWHVAGAQQMNMAKISGSRRRLDTWIQFWLHPNTNPLSWDKSLHLSEPQFLHLLNGGHKLGTVAHSCNPSTLGGWGGQITWGEEFETSLANMEKPHFYKKFKN